MKHFHIYPNAYYNYRKNRKKSFLEQRQKIFEQIKRIYYNHNRILGHRPVRIFLERQGISLSKTTIHKYMNQILGLHAIVMRKKPAYMRGTKHRIFPNLLKQNFHCTEPYGYGVQILPISVWEMEKCVITVPLLICMTAVSLPL